VQPYARANISDTICDCNGGYSGADCRTLLDWWLPYQWFLFIVPAVLMALFTIWSFIKLIHVFFLEARVEGDRRTFNNLSVVSMILNLLGNALRFALRCFKPETLLMDYGESDPPRTVVKIVLNGTSIALWIASFSIIMGFWVHALNAKLHIRLATRTKIICIIGAFITLLMIPGMLLSTLFKQYSAIGTYLVIVPYVIDSTLFVVVTIILFTGCCTKKKKTPAEVSEKNLRIMAHVRLYFIIGSVSWVVVCYVGSFGGLMKPLPGMFTIYMIPYTIALIAEYTAIYATMMLVERGVGPIKLVRDVLTWNVGATPNSATKVSTSLNNSSMSASIGMPPSRSTWSVTTMNGDTNSTASLPTATVESSAKS